ncbi:MAG: ArnT family glycosyltransferase [Ruegeria sp.]
MVALDWDFTNVPQQKKRTGAFGLTDANRRFLILALGFLALVRLLLIFWLPVTDSTEARYIEIARKMVVSNDWITPQFDWGVPFWGKPPLHTWLSAIGMKLFGINPFGARILIFAATVLTVTVVFDWTRRKRNTDTALIAVIILSSSLLFFGASAFVMTDMTMVLGTTLSMVGFYQCVRSEGGQRVWGHMFFTGLAIGLMAKGPTAAVLTGIPIFLWLLTGRRWRMLRRLPWVTGVLLLAVLTAPWYAAAEFKTPGFLRYFIVGEHIERFLVPGWDGDLYGSGHSRPKGIIWLYWAGVFFPWSIFAAVLTLRASKVRKVFSRDGSGWYAYLAFWAISPLILFAPAANILPAYVLPGIPAAAILLTSLWREVWPGGGKVARFVVGATLGAMLTLYSGGAIICGISPGRLTTKSERSLVERASDLDPEMTLTYWGGRSYSAEFYSRGTVKATASPKVLRKMKTNNRRDAIAVSSQSVPEVLAIVGPRFHDMGAFGRRHLIVESPRDGDNS